MAYISQRKLAEALGLTQATVSLALKNHPRIPATTRERVLRAAEEYGYRPHHVLSSLASRRFRIDQRTTRETIAIILPATTEPERTLFSFIEATADALGLDVNFFEPSDYGTARRLSEILDHRGIRGIIYRDILTTQISLESMLEDPKRITVSAGLLRDRPHVSAVHFDHFRAIHIAAAEAEKVGFRRICFFLPGLSEGDRRMQQAALGLQQQWIFLRKNARIIHVETRGDHGKIPNDGSIETTILGSEPDCIITTGWWLVRKLNYKPPIPIAALVPQFDNLDHAGFQSSNRSIYHSAVELLSRKLFENDYALPPYSADVAILPPWRDHPGFRKA